MSAVKPEGPQAPRYGAGVRTRLAVSYGLVVLATGFVIVLLLTAAVAASLAQSPPLASQWPNVVFVQGLSVSPWNEQGFGLPGVVVYSTQIYPAAALDKLWTGEVVRRVVLYAGLALVGVVIAALAFADTLAKRVSRPLTEMAQLAGELSVADLGRRMATPPNTNDELGQMAGAFNGMMDRLQAAFEDLEQLTSHASHELRTSLAVIKAHLEFGLSNPDELGKEARAALVAADRLTDWAGDALSVSARTLQDSALSTVDLALLAAEVVDEYSRPGRQLTLDIPPEGVAPARGNDAWLRRALANLLDNAFKYGPADGPVEVKVEQRFDAVIASVTDHGPGIPEEEQDHIWARYYRGPSARNGSAQGRGLGLALVKQAAEAAGGAAWLQSRTGEGTTFFISIPLAGASDATSASGAPAPADPSPGGSPAAGGGQPL